MINNYINYQAQGELTRKTLVDYFELLPPQFRELNESIDNISLSCARFSNEHYNKHKELKNLYLRFMANAEVYNDMVKKYGVIVKRMMDLFKIAEKIIPDKKELEEKKDEQLKTMLKMRGLIKEYEDIHESFNTYRAMITKNDTYMNLIPSLLKKYRSDTSEYGDTFKGINIQDDNSFEPTPDQEKVIKKKIGIDNMEEGFLIEVGNKWMRIYKEGEKFKADDFDSVMKDILNNNN
tara:strand:+ start:1875 stop:2582 length:708 start_codon:yes stop_codon:yes gene_type:complete